MWLARQKFLALALFATALTSGLSGCSNAEQASEVSSGEDAASSQADSVGSIPEDLLASEEKGQTPETEATNADPFADLAAGEKKEDEAAAPEALAVIENGSEKEAEAVSSLTDGDKSSSAGSASAGTETYTVKSGDTLMKIAFTLYGDIDRWKDLQDWNSGKLRNGSALRRGMKLQYEAPMTAFEPEERAHSYVIQKGDTLANIADEVYGRKMKYKKLQRYNSKLIRNPNRIFAGFTIFYDITAKEIAEADARRKERVAMQGGGSNAEPVPSMISPPPASVQPVQPEPMAVAPTNLAPPAPASMPPGPNDMAPPPPPPLN